MSAIEFIERLRAKPEGHRRQLAFWTSAMLTFVIAAIWATTLGSNLSGPSGAQIASVGSAESVTAPINLSAEEASWWQNNKNRIVAGWKTITNQKK